jgi:hypothetical protein
MRSVGMILGFALVAAAGGCGNSPESGNKVAEAVTKPVPPPGVPADAVLVTGADRLRAMLVGKALEPIHKPANFDQGLEMFRSDTLWQKVGNGGVDPLPYWSPRIEWRETMFCVNPLPNSNRCSQLWIDKQQRLFVKHKYSSGEDTSVYEVRIVSRNMS